jgi:hypothetical protein
MDKVRLKLKPKHKKLPSPTLTTTVDIHIYFGLNGTGNLDDVFVDPDPAIVHVSQKVRWCFHAVDVPMISSVASVVIQFQDQKEKWFTNPDTGLPDYKLPINAVPGAQGAHGSGKGKPHPFGGGAKKNEYYVAAYDGPDGTGTLLYRIDPDVVTEDP